MCCYSFLASMVSHEKSVIIQIFYPVDVISLLLFLVFLSLVFRSYTMICWHVHSIELLKYISLQLLSNLENFHKLLFFSPSSFFPLLLGLR